MACLDNIIEINKSDCIGNSRETINTNFNILKDKVCSLDTQTTIIEEKSIYYVPLYGIIMYYGDITPGGTDFEPNGIGRVSKNLQAFAVCNGANGTPNMQDRFVVGAGGSYAQKTFGPQVPGQPPTTTNDTLSLQFSSVKLDVTEMPTHTHDVIEPRDSNNNVGHNHGGSTPANEAAHKHKFDYHGAKLDPSEDGSGNPQPDARYNFYIGGETNTDGQHQHTIPFGTTGITLRDKGNSQKHENRPPYIALGYIMRIL